MPGTNLTRDEATARAARVRAEAYRVELDLTKADDTSVPTFTSTTELTFTCTEPGSSTWLDLIASGVAEVTLNGTALDPAALYDGSRLTLPDLASQNEVRVVAEANFMRTGEGLHRFTDPVDDEVYLYSQFEVADARRVFACFDQPDLKATFEVVVHAPAKWTVISCYPTARVEPGGGDLLGGEPEPAAPPRRWTFERTPRLSTYVMAVCAGPYVEVTDYHQGRNGRIELGLYCRASLQDYLDSEELFTVTKQGFGFFEQAFDYPYPFAKYDQVFVPEFNAGAMENVGCVTYRDEYLFRSRVTDAAYERRAETLLHEMAHMWFGDLVTMRWWDDLWLNESFATWASVLAQAEATRWTDAWTTFATTEKLWALRQDQLPTTHPISADAVDLVAVENNFDGITYAKGASVLKQLVAYVGREEFLRGLRRYFVDNAYGNTTMQDLFDELEAESGRDLAAWERAWLQTAGVNTLAPVLAVSDGVLGQVAVRQSADDDYPTLRPHRIVVGRYDLRDGALKRTDRVEMDIHDPLTDLPHLAGESAPDLLLINDDDLTFAKIRFDEASLQTLITTIGLFEESLPQAMCWTAATDMLRDAQLAARDYVTLVLSGVTSTPDLGVVQTVLRTAHGAVLSYSDPRSRPALTARLAEGLRGLCDGAEPGGDMQLALVRAWVALAPQDSARDLWALLDGAGSFPGLTVDTELRWHVLQRLAALGVADEGAIAAEEASDNTAAGQRHAAHARAACPEAALKAASWTQVTTPDRLSNAMSEATLAGFVQPEQVDTMAPYVSRYFDGARAMWEKHTPKSAERLLDGLFPRFAVSRDTIERAEAWAQRNEDLPGAVRIVTEGAADVRRAIAAQQADAEAAQQPAQP